MKANNGLVFPHEIFNVYSLAYFLDFTADLTETGDRNEYEKICET